MSAWRHPAARRTPVLINFVKETALKAEEGKLDFIFVADGFILTKNRSPFFNRFEPLTVLSALAAVTGVWGWWGPYPPSRALYHRPPVRQRPFMPGTGGLERGHFAAGRSAKNFSRAQHPDHALRYRIADEYLQVVKGLWDSWEEDAFVRNKETASSLIKINCIRSIITAISLKSPGR
jgi:hypothetical protein